MKFAQKKFLTPKGFTLIELLVVITIIAALAVTVFAALNPSKRLEDSKDARRTTDVDTILTAIHAYVVDNGGDALGLGLAATDTQLGTGAAGVCSPVSAGGCSVAADTACIDLSITLDKYLKDIPVDPSGGTYTAVSTGYVVSQDANGIVTVKACGAEGGTNISSSR